VLAFVAIAGAFAWPIQGGGGVVNANYVLTKAIATGTARIDRAVSELGDFSTADYARFNGHRYSNKAPGLALVALPPYVVLKTSGIRTKGDPGRMLWALGLFGCVVPAIGLLALVRERAESVEAGFGTAAAVALGAGTLILPYATVFLSHVLAAVLLFGSFTLLWRERERTPRALPLFTAGVLCGYAVTAEYPSALGAAILLGYAVCASRPLRRATAFAAGGLVGVLALALYNLWAFGDVLHNSYSGVGDNEQVGDLFGAPSARIALDLLFSANGLVVLVPVTACAAYGLWLVFRAGRRAEAAVIAAFAVVFLAFNSAYFSPFGGSFPGTRHLIVVLPFLAVALAPAIRALPVTCCALALVSALLMTLITATHVFAAYDGLWLDRVRAGELTPAVPSLVGITGWYAIVPFALAVGVALVAAALVTPLRATSADTLLAAAALLAWAFLAVAAPSGPDALEYRNYAAIAGLAAAGAALAAVRGVRRGQSEAAAERTSF
jgi:hypothetical protein